MNGVVVCPCCANVMVFDDQDDLRPRSPSIDELLDLLDDPRVEDAIRATALYRKLFGETGTQAKANDATGTRPAVL